MSEERDKPLALVVDDDPVIRRLVRRALERFACCQEVLEAGDGIEAQALLRERPDIALVLTDIMMPRLDGLELLRWGRHEIPSIAWIILSGLDTFDTAVEAIRLGAFDFLAKPPRIEEMEVSVRNALERQQLLKERERLTTELEDANLQLLSQVRELEEQSALLGRDLERAEVIQRALLPGRPPAIERYCVHAVYRPGRHVGGDLYDVVRIQDRYLSLYVADATGHGVTAAMLSVLYKQRLVRVDEATGEPLTPDQVLASVNRALGDAVMAPGLFLTAVYCLLDTVDGTVSLASAGHTPVLHVPADGEVRSIRRTGPALGLSADAHFAVERFRLAPNDRLLLYTDGLLGSGSAAEIDRLRELVSRTSTGTEQLLAELVANAQRDGSGREVEDPDDIALLLLEMRTGESSFDNGATQPARSGSSAAPRAGPIFYGESETASYLALRGRATWLQCNAFYETAMAILAARRPLVVDLSACEYLDSTCLGTLHELVGAGDVQLHGVRSEVRDLFEELDMRQVLARIGDTSPAPELYPLTTSASDPKTARTRILHAHETLAALSERNQEKFRTLLAGMRRDPEHA